MGDWTRVARGLAISSENTHIPSLIEPLTRTKMTFPVLRRHLNEGNMFDKTQTSFWVLARNLCKGILTIDSQAPCHSGLDPQSFVGYSPGRRGGG